MRPTLLNFLSPKEKTGEYLNPQITNYGINLKYNPAKSNIVPKSFLTFQKRFLNYDENENNLKGLVGPSTYFENYFCSKRQERIPKTFVKPHFTLDKNDPNSYMMVGNSIVYSPNKEESRSRNVSTCNKCQRRQLKDGFLTFYPASHFNTFINNSTCHSTKTHFQLRNKKRSLYKLSDYSLLAKMKGNDNDNKIKAQSLSVSNTIPKKRNNKKRIAKTFYGNFVFLT